ncbi:unnamed protein product [Oreochromis niloticus]|nr:unnamed protein product [Mustela putorius furo]
MHVEAQFALRGISADDTKYHHVVASLDPLATRRAMPLLRDPPAQGKYAALKELLLRRYALSQLLPAKDYRSLAEEADRILLASRTFNVHAVATDSPATPSTPPPASPGASAPLLTAGIATRRHGGKNICFYHQRFGDRARRCLPPCAFTAQGNGPASVVPLPDRVQAVSAFPRPTSVKALQEFLGMINFYNRFLPRAAHLLQPLYAALKGKTAKDPVDWLPERIHAFSAAKSALADAALLAHPLPSAEIALTTDASDVAVGGVLEQRVSGLWQPLAFFSRTLRDAERKYSVFDRELLALHLATRHFRFFLEGRNFTAYVDHKPLTFAMSKVSDPWSARQQRQLAAISEFTTYIQHVAGKSNHVADCLSRVLVSPVYVGVDYAAMAAEQHADPDILALQSMKTGLVLEDTPVWDGGPRLLCDVSTGRPRPVVPLSWRRRVFDSVHALSHPSVRASVKLVSARFVWPDLRKTVKEWAAVCVPCQRSKIHRHTQAPLEPFRTMPIGLRCVHHMTGRTGFLNQATNISFWTLAVGRKLSLLTDLSLHMLCKRIRAQAPRRSRPPATGLMDSVFSPRSGPQSPESESSAAFSDRQCQPRFRAGLPSVSSPPPRFSRSGRLLRPRVLD